MAGVVRLAVMTGLAGSAMSSTYAPRGWADGTSAVAVLS